MSIEFFENLTLIAFIFLFAPVVISSFRFSYFNSIQKKLLTLISLMVLVELVSRILWYRKINNLPLYHFYTIIEFLLILNIYRSALATLFSKKAFVVLGVAFTGFAIINMIFLQDLFTFNSNVTTLLGVIVIFLCLSYFYALLKEVKYSSLEKNPMFWINSGFLIYFSSNLILFFVNNNLFKDSTEASYLVWGLHAIVNIVLTLFYTIAVLVRSKKIKI